MEKTTLKMLGVLFQPTQNPKEKLEELFQPITQYPIFILNILCGRFEFVSKKFVDLLGYPHSQVMQGGMYFISEMLAVDDYRRIVSSYLQLLQQIHEQNWPQCQRYSWSFKMIRAGGHCLSLKLFMIYFKEKLGGGEQYFVGLLKEIGQSDQKGFWKAHIEEERIFVKLRELIDKLCAGMDLSRDSHNHQPMSKPISHREIEVLNLLSRGFSSKLLASKLHISQHTVETHRKNLLQKFQVKNTAELIKAAHNYLV